MGALFSRPKTPNIPAPPAPSAPPASVDAVVASDDETKRLRKKRGVASTILAGESASPTGSVATKTLLGS